MGGEEELKSIWERLRDSILVKKSAHSLQSRILSHVLHHRTRIRTTACLHRPPPGPSAILAPFTGTVSTRDQVSSDCLGKTSKQQTQSAVRLRWLEHGQGRGNAGVHPSQAKAGLSAGGSWSCMKVLVFLLDSHAEGL